MNAKAIQHLYSRAGFGISPKLLQSYSDMNKQDIVDSLFKKSASYTPLKIDLSEFLKLNKKDVKNKALIMELLKKSNKKIQIFNTKWIERLATSEELLREKMTLFWANHFVCKDKNIVFVQHYNNTLRKHALGDFRSFVKAISKEAAMINYLNIKQNRKLKPNENFARELMELFTLGVGNYSEKDIKESARAFTGYDHNMRGEFLLKSFQHDEGEKTFFGENGNFDGDDIIDIILKQKQCAHFICCKIYSYFVNETINYNHVEELTNIFYKDYNIKKLMQHLFMSSWFYDEKHIGTKIKSPIEFMVGMQKVVPMRFEKTIDLLKIQKLLGQILLNPPNVAGWKGGKNWIDSNTIMLRLKLPSILLANATISIKEKGEFDDTFKAYYSKKKTENKFVTVSINWDVFNENFKNVSFEDMKTQLLSPKLNKGTESYLGTLKKSSKKDFCVQLMSLPEYQMC